MGGKYFNFVAVDLLTKYTYFIPMDATDKASEIVELFMQHIYMLHRLPKNIGSEGDLKFLSNFWKELFKVVGTTLIPTTSYHP